MTKVQTRLELARPLEDHRSAIAAAHTLYGIFRVIVEPGERSILVEYDASRLTPYQLSAALVRCGVPVNPVAHAQSSWMGPYTSLSESGTR